MIAFAGMITPEESRLIHAYLIEVGHNTLENEQARGSLWSRVKSWTYAVAAKIAEWGVGLLGWFRNAGD